MNQELWNSVDSYIAGKLVGEDLDFVLKASDAAGLPPIAVSPAHGKLLHLYARAIGARRVLEIGTLGGYSTIWLARALPEDGKVITCEYSARHAEVAKANLQAAGVAGKVEIRVGAALDTLPQLSGGEPFDLVFVDADKENNPHYWQWALRLTRPGALIIVDNVVRGGKVAAASDEPMIVGTRALYDAVAASGQPATAVQTLGVKGYDGFLIALRTDEA
ncbi:O-methyltransferase [Allorhizocola rhizosphaerae]|uniref:O-methyltransferase n=1 Tax=Allorhizocola rhizosphaerae TaxID=1872709 RepID=UPI0013C35FAE|nr:O-methyltransferase [Allorhizocola rhizosphaerae]